VISLVRVRTTMKQVIHSCTSLVRVRTTMEVIHALAAVFHWLLSKCFEHFNRDAIDFFCCRNDTIKNLLLSVEAII